MRTAKAPPDPSGRTFLLYRIFPSSARKNLRIGRAKPAVYQKTAGFAADFRLFLLQRHQLIDAALVAAAFEVCGKPGIDDLQG